MLQEDRFADMAERNRELTRQNQTLNRELTILHKEMQDEAGKKENQIHEMGKANRELQKNLEEQEMVIINLRAENTRIINEQKMHLKKSDMLSKIKLLNDAYASKKITKEKHMVRSQRENIETRHFDTGCINKSRLLKNCFQFCTLLFTKCYKGFTEKGNPLESRFCLRLQIFCTYG